MRAWIERQGEMKSGLGVEWKWKQIQTNHKDYFKEAKKRLDMSSVPHQKYAWVSVVAYAGDPST